MIFAYFTLAVALLIEVVGAYYSITGLAAIFSGAVVPILIMGGSLELGKVTAAVWLKNNWHRASIHYKLYLLPAVAMLMLITSMGIFGFLSKAHNDQTLVSGDVGSKIAIYDEKIKTARDNIEAGRKQLQQMDAAVDQVMARSTTEQGADKSNAIRRSQARDRAQIARDIEANQKIIAKLNDEAAPIRAEVRKVEAEVGPIKYIAKLIYADNPDANILEKAVTWVIMIIVAVFDPLALVLILAAQQSIRWEQGEEPRPTGPNRVNEYLNNLKARIRNRFKKKEEIVELVEAITEENKQEEVVVAPVKPKRKPRKKPVAKKKAKPAPKKKPVAVKKPTKKAPAKKKVLVKQPVVETKPKVTRKKKVKEIIVAEPEKIILDDSPFGFGPEKTEVFVSPNVEGLDASIERPGDYLKPEEAPVVVEPERPREAAPGRNRGVITGNNTQEIGQRIKIIPDDLTNLGKASHSDFGNVFPENPNKGDVYLRTDYLPNRLFKFNGNKWIELDKSQIDVYAYDEAYIKHLIEEIDSGRYDTELLTDVEREQIKQYLEKNAQ